MKVDTSPVLTADSPAGKPEHKEDSGEKFAAQLTSAQSKQGDTGGGGTKPPPPEGG